MSDVQQAEESYQANTVEELRDELRARDLPVSGNKDELIARLEEDDAARAAGESDTQIEAQIDAEMAAEADPQNYYPPRVYSPFELPANTAAARSFVDANPGAVGTDLATPLEPPERHEAALASIQDHVDQMAAVGVPIEDPRLPDSGPPPDPTLDAISPESALVGPPGDILLTATGSGFTQETQIAFGVFSQEEADQGLGEVGEPKWEQTTFGSNTTLGTILTAGLHPDPDAAVPVVIGTPGGFVSPSLDFAFIEPEPPDPPDPEPPAGPAITSLNPDNGETGTQVTIVVTGTGFADTSTVEADGAAQPTTFTSDTELTADFTPAASGTVNITVRNADDQESNDMPFTVQDAPEE